MRTNRAREGEIFGMAPRAVPGTSAGVNEDYLQRFGGIGRLYGAAALPRLQAAHVCVVGVGGVGSWTVEGLARSGIGALTLVDHAPSIKGSKINACRTTRIFWALHFVSDYPVGVEKAKSRQCVPWTTTMPA